MMHIAWMECFLLVQEVVLVHLVSLLSTIFMEMVILVPGALQEKHVMRIIIKLHVEMKIIQHLVIPKLRLLSKVCRGCLLEVERYHGKNSKLHLLNRLNPNQRSLEK